MKLRVLLILTLLGLSNSFLSSQNWVKLNGPVGAEIITSVITRSGEIYCGTRSGKIFYSLDKGQNWNNISAGLTANGFSNNIHIKESPRGLIYLNYNNQLYLLDKNSNSWNRIAPTLQFLNFTFSPNGKIYAGNSRNFFISDDGVNFKNIQSWSAGSLEFLCLGNNNNFVRIITGSAGDIWRFNDDGSGLIQILLNSGTSGLFYHYKSNTLFDFSNVINYSKDFGNSWTNHKIETGINKINNIAELKDGSLISFEYNFKRSIDNGLNWNTNHNYDKNSNSYFFGPSHITVSDNDEILIQNELNLFLFVPNKPYILLEVPTEETNVSEFVQFGPKNIYVKNSQIIQFSNDDGISWNSIVTNYVYPNLFWKDGTIGAMRNGNVNLTLSDDFYKTKTGKFIKEGLSLKGVFVDNNENIIFIDGNNVNISYNKGDSWNLIGKDLIIPNFGGFDLLKISKQNIIYGSLNNFFYYSLDLGISWNKIQINGITNSAVTLTQNNTLIFGYNYSTDFGKTIKSINIPTQERFLLADEFDNIYSLNSNKLYIYNVITKTKSTIDLSQFNTSLLNTLKIYRGENDFLYAIFPNSPIYKFDQKLERNINTIIGNLIIDENNDCVKSNNEILSNNFLLEIKNNSINYYIPSNPEGKFKAFIQEGTYDVNLITNSPIWSECNFPKNINIIPNSTSEFQDLMIKPNELCADLKTNVVMGRLRRCFDNQTANLRIRNEGSTSAVNSKVTVIFDDYFEDITSNFSPSLTQGNIWEFTIPEIKDGESFIIAFKFKVSCAAELNKLHCIKYLFENNQACKSIIINTDTSIICERNQGSFDPNDKTAIVNGIQSDVIHQTDSLIEYLIRFQNTGTDTAFNIRISDKLDYHLDWSSFNILSSSHPQTYSISDGGTLEFQFNNILLPDSNVNERSSNGYVMYSIKPKLSQLKFGTLISNRAEIYFDFNEPIATNTAVVKLTPITRVNDINQTPSIELVAIPNPTDYWTNIELPDHLKHKNLNIKLSNSTGTELRIYKFNGNRIRIEKNELVAGVYFLTISDKNGMKAYSKIVFE